MDTKKTSKTIETPVRKLHLGCGQRYLDGYVNIDFPVTEHSVQYQVVADIEADITALSYPLASITEIRLHHVFEHFTRPVALALVASWHSWLQPSGRLRIEVPDFYRTALVLLNPLASKQRKFVAERHLFGSHEAAWAVHCDGYTSGMLKQILQAYGFRIEAVKKNHWLGTHNVEIIGIRGTNSLSMVQALNIGRDILSQSLLDRSASEMNLLQVWLNLYERQLQTSWSCDV